MTWAIAVVVGRLVGWLVLLLCMYVCGWCWLAMGQSGVASGTQRDLISWQRRQTHTHNDVCIWETYIHTHATTYTLVVLLCKAHFSHLLVWQSKEIAVSQIYMNVCVFVNFYWPHYQHSSVPLVMRDIVSHLIRAHMYVCLYVCDIPIMHTI